jgi:hypothetical protein
VFSPSSVEHCSNTARDDVARSFLAFAQWCGEVGVCHRPDTSSAMRGQGAQLVRVVGHQFHACDGKVVGAFEQKVPRVHQTRLFVYVEGNAGFVSTSSFHYFQDNFRCDGVRGIVPTASIHTTSLVDKRKALAIGSLFRAVTRWNQWGHRTIARVADV